MTEVHRLSELRREYIADGDGSALRATWHNEAGYVVLSLWRGDTCVATSHLTPREAGRLAAFITGGLADLAEERREPWNVTDISSGPTWRDRAVRVVAAWKDSVGWSLEKLARSLRSPR